MFNGAENSFQCFFIPQVASMVAALYFSHQYIYAYVVFQCTYSLEKISI